MIYSDFTYSGITFKRFVRTSGYMAEVVSGDRINIRSTRDPLPAQDGIQRYIDKYGSRLLQIRGWIKGSTESDLYNKINDLQRAFDIKVLEQAGNYGFRPLVWTDPGQGEAQYFVKPLSDTLAVTEDRSGLARRFTVLLEAKDPKKYSSSSTTYTITIDTDDAGSSSFPFSFPVPFSSSSSYGEGTVSNDGNSPVFPDSIKMYGSSSGNWTAPRVTNSTSGDIIEFTSDVVLEDGQYILITPNIGTAVKYNGSAFEDVSQYITSRSVIWQLSPGNSTIRVDGTVSPDDAYVEITVISSFS